eukprot:7063118-Prymnesium_polylepis.1
MPSAPPSGVGGTRAPRSQPQQQPPPRRHAEASFGGRPAAKVKPSVAERVERLRERGNEAMIKKDYVSA